MPLANKLMQQMRQKAFADAPIVPSNVEPVRELNSPIESQAADLGAQLHLVEQEKEKRLQVETKLAEIASKESESRQQYHILATQWRNRGNTCMQGVVVRLAIAAGATFVLGYVLFGRRKVPQT